MGGWVAPLEHCFQKVHMENRVNILVLLNTKRLRITAV